MSIKQCGTTLLHTSMQILPKTMTPPPRNNGLSQGNWEPGNAPSHVIQPSIQMLGYILLTEQSSIHIRPGYPAVLVGLVDRERAPGLGNAHGGNREPGTSFVHQFCYVIHRVQFIQRNGNVHNKEQGTRTHPFHSLSSIHYHVHRRHWSSTQLQRNSKTLSVT